MTDKQFYAACQDAQQYSDPDAFASDVALSAAFSDTPEDQLPGLMDDLRHVWRYMHITVREIVQYTGLTQTAFAARHAIPLRTLQGWIAGSRDCPPYIRLMLAKLCGI